MIMKAKATVRLALILVTVLALGIVTNQWFSSVKAEEQKPMPKYFKYIGSHVEGANSVHNVYCDTERGNLIYSYLASVDSSVSTSLVVLSGGCKK